MRRTARCEKGACACHSFDKFDRWPGSALPTRKTRWKLGYRAVPEPDIYAKAMDPAQVLPTELMFMILEHIEPAKVWTLRALSKKWNALLRHDSLVEAILRQGETHDPSDAAPRTRAAREAALLAHLRARPVGTIDVRISKPKGEKFAEHMPYLKGKYLAFLHRRDSIYVINLQTQEKTCVETGIVSQFVLTDTMLICAVMGELQYRFLDDLEKAHIIQLPLPPISAVAGSGSHLAVMQGLRLLIFEGQDLVRSIDLPQPRLATFGTALVMEGHELASSSCLVIFCPQTLAGQPVPATANSVRVNLSDSSIEVQRFPRIQSTVRSFGISLLPSGDGEYFHTSGRGYSAKLHYHRLSKEWELLKGKSQARWKGNIYRKSTYQNWTMIRAGKSVLLRAKIVQYPDSQLLINDSYLVNWDGGPDCVFDVLTFDKQEGMRELPLFEGPLNKFTTRKWCWMKEKPDVAWYTP